MAQTYKFGKDGTWATKKGSTLAYSDTNNAFKPLPFSFERNSIATRVNKEGLIEVVGNDIPRIDYTDSTEGVLLLEPSRTNYASNSIAFNEWSNGITYITSNYAISPDGTLNASRCLFTSENQLIFSGTSATGTVTSSVYVKGVKNETLYLGAGGLGEVITLNGEWQRIQTTQTNINGQISINTAGGATARDFLIWGAQLEVGNLSSYIPTNGSTVQRAAETCSESGNSEVFNDSQGVLFADIAALADDGTFRQISLNDTTSNNIIQIDYTSTSNQIRGVVISSGSLTAFISFISTNVALFSKVAFKYKENNFALWVNGFEIGTDTSGNTAVGLSELAFDNGVGGNDFYGKTKEIGYYDTALTDEELETLTSYRSLNEMVTELNLNAL